MDRYIAVRAKVMELKMIWHATARSVKVSAGYRVGEEVFGRLL